MTPLTQPNLGKDLKAWRKAQGLTLAQLGKETGCSKGHLHKIEAGRDLQLSTLNRLLKAQGMIAVGV